MLLVRSAAFRRAARGSQWQPAPCCCCRGATAAAPAAAVAAAAADRVSRPVSCGSTARHAKEFTPSPYDCRPGIPGSGSQLRTGGHATQGGAPLAPDALETPAVWVSRVEFGIYRLGVSRAAAASVDGLGFVDLAEVGSVLSEGRPFGMVEGTGGMLGLVSSISGEVISGAETFLCGLFSNEKRSLDKTGSGPPQHGF